MDEIEFRENATLVREGIKDIANEALRTAIERILAMMEFMDGRITELQDEVDGLA